MTREEIKERLSIEYHLEEIKDNTIIDWRQALRDIQSLISECERLEEKIKELEKIKGESFNLIKQLILMIDEANPVAWKTGIEWMGMDEGMVRAGEYIQSIKKEFEELEKGGEKLISSLLAR